MTRRGATLLLVSGVALGLATAGGCHTPVGNYFANRARDLGECFRVEVGGGVGIGGGAELGGIAHLGIGGGFRYAKHGLGWDYGYGYVFGAETEPGEEYAWEGYMPAPFLWLPVHGHWRPMIAHSDERFPIRGGSKAGTSHACPFGLPGLFSQGRVHWIWGHSEPNSAWARLHAFDIGVSVYAGVVFAAIGFSPGEFLDFVLGWFGVDIARDDRAWALPAPPATGE